jgi:hypothetical protein
MHHVCDGIDLNCTAIAIADDIQIASIAMTIMVGISIGHGYGRHIADIADPPGALVVRLTRRAFYFYNMANIRSGSTVPRSATNARLGQPNFPSSYFTSESLAIPLVLRLTESIFEFCYGR